MQLEDFFDFNTEPVEHIRIKGTRISIDHVIELYKRHMTPEQIAVYFGCPLDPVQVYATITYYLANKEAVDAYLARGEERFQKHYDEYLAERSSPVVERLRDLKKRFTDESGRLDFEALREHMAKERGGAVAKQ